MKLWNPANEVIVFERNKEGVTPERAGIRVDGKGTQAEPERRGERGEEKPAMVSGDPCALR